ncbi:MAG TPA: Gfo/Idh/MocA family oxidoreductase, partial [Agriterribacter sp.]|nr:Gfo/Idh/MocA family oxidoreductase [Agriterribacter sp.]
NTTEEARQLVHIAAGSGKVLSVYQNRRYVSDFRTMKAILDKKLLGDIHEFEAHYDRYRMEARPAAWREAPLPGSGILYDLGAH